jgi:hypothetical protein
MGILAQWSHDLLGQVQIFHMHDAWLPAFYPGIIFYIVFGCEERRIMARKMQIQLAWLQTA